MQRILLLVALAAAPAGALKPATRQSFLSGTGAAACLSAFAPALPAAALVKGSAPPAKRARAGEGRTCRDIDACEEEGRVRSAERFGEELPFETTPQGVRYRDVRAGAGEPIARGDTVALKYRVMRLGKRATDNLSGEASPVFSLGYGEDDDASTDKLAVRVGGGTLISALESALVGMNRGAKRRLFVVPEKGWKKTNGSCDASTNGASNSGDASAGGMDVLGQAIVPLAQMVDNDACIASDLLPQPRNYGAKRRLARRFDEGLLLEVEVLPE